MHIFIGGAHNGKRAYVKKLLKEQGKSNVQWIEGMPPQHGENPLVIAGIESWLAETELSEDALFPYLMESFTNREVILILTDIGRGIVPVEHEQRHLRDVCGRLYQRLFSEANEVTRIWYGIAQIVKKRGEE